MEVSGIICTANLSVDFSIIDNYGFIILDSSREADKDIFSWLCCVFLPSLLHWVDWALSGQRQRGVTARCDLSVCRLHLNFSLNGKQFGFHHKK